METKGARLLEGRSIPDVVFKTRVRDDGVGGDNPFRWQDVQSRALFAGRRVVVFALPGAFTPTCTNEQCPAFEQMYDELRAAGADEVYCLSVNDAFVMYQWGKHLGLKKVQLLPDGSGHFTRRMGMLINKDHLGFGYRSWRYAMIVDNGVIETFLEEPGINDEGADDDPYGATDPQIVREHLLAMRTAPNATRKGGVENEPRTFVNDDSAAGEETGSPIAPNEGRLGPAGNPVEGKP